MQFLQRCAGHWSYDEDRCHRLGSRCRACFFSTLSARAWRISAVLNAKQCKSIGNYTKIVATPAPKKQPPQKAPVPKKQSKIARLTSITEHCMRGRPNCDVHSPANRFEPCNNSTTCVEYSLKGTVATACLALLEGDCLSVPMFTYPCSVCCLLSDEYAIRLPRIMYAS